ncbi:hypothetical protein N2152v2_007314 [Parachlorella kessleri]
MDKDRHSQRAPGTISVGDPFLDTAERELEQELRESHRLVTMESSVTLELQPPSVHQDVCVRLVFAEPAAVPMLVRIEHGVSPAAKFEALGEIRLQPKSLRQLRHLFRLGRQVAVGQCLRITSALAELALQQEEAAVQPMPDGAAREAARSSELGAAQLQYTMLGPRNAVSLGQQTIEKGCNTDAPASIAMPRTCPASPGAVSYVAGKFAAAAAVDRPEQEVVVAAAPWQTEPALLMAEARTQVDVPQIEIEAGQPLRPHAAAGSLARTEPLSHQQEDACVPHLSESLVQQPAPPAANPEPAAVQPALQGPSAASMPPHPPPPPPKPPGARKPTSVAASASPAASPAKCPPPPPPPRPPVVTPRKAPAPPSLPPKAAAGGDGQQSPQRTPKRQMVKLFWQKLPPNQVQGTVWSSPQLKTLQAEVDYEALEDDFAAKATVKASPCKVPRGATLLPLKRCNNVGIVLKKLKLTPWQVKESVLKLLGEDFPTARDLADEEIASLLPCLPTQDEEALLKSYKGHLEDLGVVERFMLEMLEIPSVGPRLEALRFAAQFNSKVAWLQSLATLLSQACQEVRECSQLTEVLRVALAVGNFLNAGNSNGCAAGFQVDSLLKLKDVKSTRSSTLLHFLAREVARQQPGGASPLKSCLPSCTEASKLTLGVLHADLAEISAGVKQVEGALSLGTSSAAFAAGMQTFLSRARKMVEQLTAHVSGAENSFRDLGNFLNGQRGTMKEPSAFFHVLATFSDDFDRALVENAALDQAAAKKAEQSSKKLSSSRMTAASGRLESSASPMRQKDKGAVERLRQLKIKRRHSVTAEHMPHDAEVSMAAVLRPQYVPESVPAFRSRPASPVVLQMPHGSTRRPGTSPAVLQPAARPSAAVAVRPTSAQNAVSRSSEKSQPTSSTAAPSSGDLYAPLAGPNMKGLQEPMRYSKSAAQSMGAFGSDILGLSSSSGGDTVEATSCSPSQGRSRLTSGGSALEAAVAGDSAQLQLSISVSVGSVPAGGPSIEPARTSAPAAATAPSAGSSPFGRPAAAEQPVKQGTPKGLAVCEPSQLCRSGSLRSLGALSPTSTPLAAMGSRRSSAMSLAPAALWRSTSASGLSPPGESAEEQLVQPGQLHDMAKVQHSWQDAATFCPADPDSPELLPERTPDCFAALAEAVIRESLLGPPTASNWVSSSVEAAGLLTPAAAGDSEADRDWPSAVGDSDVSHAAGFDVELLVGMMGCRGAEKIAAANPQQQQGLCQGQADLGRTPSPAGDAAGSPFTMVDMLRAVPTPMASQQHRQQEGSAPAWLQRYDPGVEQAMAAVLASAGSSPTGKRLLGSRPLGQGVRASLQELKMLRPGQAGLDISERPQRHSNGPPVMPQPLGEGVR